MKTQRFIGWAVLAFGLMVLGGVAQGQLIVKTDTTSTSAQTYTTVAITNNARLTLDGAGANWVTSGNVDVGVGGATTSSRGHLLLTNGATLQVEGNLFVLSPSQATGTVTVAGGMVFGGGVLWIGGWTVGALYGAGSLYVGEGGVVSNIVVISSGKVIVENGGRITQANKAINVGKDRKDSEGELVVRGAATRVMQGTTSAATLLVGAYENGRASITDGAIVTNYGTRVGDANSASLPAGTVTGRLTVASGARLYSSSDVTAGMTPGGGQKMGGIGIITVTDSNTVVEAMTVTIEGTNASYPSSMLITSQATVRANSQLAVGQGSVLITEGGTLELPGTQINILASTSGTISNRGGVIAFAVGLASLGLNNNGQLGRMVTDSGTISIKGRNNEYGIYDNQDSKLTNITFIGTNSFMLDAASTKTATSQNYLFNTGLGAVNYAGLILKNKSTYQGGMATIGANGWLESSGSGITNTLAEICTNWGKATVLSGTVKFSKSLQNYGLFGGSGRVEGGVTNYSGSTVAPGGTNGYGTLTFAASNTVKSGATVAYQFGGTGAGQYDAVVVESGAKLDITGSTLTCELKYLMDGTQTWTLIDNQGAVTGTFTGPTRWVQTYQGRTYVFMVNYSGGDGNDVVLTCTRAKSGTSLTLY